MKEDFVVNPFLSEFEELKEVNPIQLATGGGLTVAQPQTHSQDTILAILQELRVNMQSMDERVNELSAKMNQFSRGAKHRHLDTDTNLCEVHHRHTMPLRRLDLRLFDTQSVGPTVTPTQTFLDYSLQVSFPDLDDEEDGEVATTGTKLFLISQKTEFPE